MIVKIMDNSRFECHMIEVEEPVLPYRHNPNLRWEKNNECPYGLKFTHFEREGLTITERNLQIGCGENNKSDPVKVVIDDNEGNCKSGDGYWIRYKKGSDIRSIITNCIVYFMENGKTVEMLRNTYTH